jgi:hypothetical protein
MPNVVVTITPSAGANSVTVHIDAQDVTNSGNNPVPLVGGNHALHWWFSGNAGETLAISIDPAGGGANITKVSDSIAPGFVVEAGDKKFAV